MSNDRTQSGTSMTIALVGFGKMGREVARAAAESGVSVRSIIDPVAPDATAKEISGAALDGCDVVLDFSHPTAVLSNVRGIASFGKNMVVGTTGWYDKLEDVKRVVKAAEIGLIWSGNFSLGVQVFFQILSKSSELINRFTNYDISVHEVHHNQKADAPSGTAVMMGQIILGKVSRKQSVVKGTPAGVVKPDELQVTSQRIGSTPGTHTVTMDSLEDTIELKHIAKGRQGFAAGALVAAQWIRGKKGLYDIHDMMNAITKAEKP